MADHVRPMSFATPHPVDSPAGAPIAGVTPITLRERLAVLAVFTVELAIGVSALLVFWVWLVARDVPANGSVGEISPADRAALGGSRSSAAPSLAESEDQTAAWKRGR